MEGIVNFGPNVESSGAYVPPNDAPYVHHMEQALEAASKVMEEILIGDLNTT